MLVRDVGVSNCHGVHNGWSIFPSSTFESISTQGDWVPSQMHLPITWTYTLDLDWTPHPPMSVHCSPHGSWRPPHPAPAYWITLLEDSQKHWTSSKSGQRSLNSSLVTHLP